jgi:hypothetical protein
MAKTGVITASFSTELHSAQAADSQPKPNDAFVEIAGVTEDHSMPGSVFKIVVDGGDWGSPMANEATFDNLEEAQAEARSYLERQRQAGASLRVTVEESTPDGSVVRHAVD